MKIATFNIDWAKAHKSRSHVLKITSFLDATDFDFLILTEAISLDLDSYPFVYKTTALPIRRIYEGMDYGKYLNGQQPYRTIIYSRHKATAIIPVTDSHTSLCVQFGPEMNDIILYGTIIGTQFRKKPYAVNELENCVADCKRIHAEHGPLFLAGDLNTAFDSEETYWQISRQATESITRLAADCDMVMATAALKENIDHIFVPRTFAGQTTLTSKIFVEKGVLSDHQGVMVEFT